MPLFLALGALLLITWGWHHVPKSWADVDAQWGMDPDHPENASEAFNRGISAPGFAGPAMSLGVFVLVGSLVTLLVYGV